MLDLALATTSITAWIGLISLIARDQGWPERLLWAAVFLTQLGVLVYALG
jgi:hypothetical protein